MIAYIALDFALQFWTVQSNDEGPCCALGDEQIAPLEVINTQILARVVVYAEYALS